MVGGTHLPVLGNSFPPRRLVLSTHHSPPFSSISSHSADLKKWVSVSWIGLGGEDPQGAPRAPPEHPLPPPAPRPGRGRASPGRSQARFSLADESGLWDPLSPPRGGYAHRLLGLPVPVLGASAQARERRPGCAVLDSGDWPACQMALAPGVAIGPRPALPDRWFGLVRSSVPDYASTCAQTWPAGPHTASPRPKSHFVISRSAVRIRSSAPQFQALTRGEHSAGSVG
jgi:hypothetical protein